MSHRFDAVSRTVCDIMTNDKPFGGVVTLLAGDFRQILPVVRLGRRADIVDAALTRSTLWKEVILLKLDRNMRVEKYGRDADQVSKLRHHADWLLQLGDGRLPHVQSDVDNIELPSDLCVSTVHELVDFVFADLPSHYTDTAWIFSV